MEFELSRSCKVLTVDKGIWYQSEIFTPRTCQAKLRNKGAVVCALLFEISIRLSSGTKLDFDGSFEMNLKYFIPLVNGTYKIKCFY